MYRNFVTKNLTFESKFHNHYGLSVETLPSWPLLTLPTAINHYEETYI